jgi:ketosteroid isomerase-like protein
MLETQRDLELVRSANRLFYEALERRDLFAMARIWDHSADVRCVHPGWEMLTGWEEVRESFEAIFQATEAMRITVSDARIAIHGSIAVVCLVENLFSAAVDRGSLCELQTTNMFRFRKGRWKMIHHHASPFVRHMTAPPLSYN